MILTSKHVVDEARTWLGTPWHHQAMRKGVGADCVGLLAGIARELDIFDASLPMRDPLLRGYGRDADPEKLALACSTYLDRTDKKLKLGRVLFLRVPMAVYPQHFALVSREDPPYMIHAAALHPKCVVEVRIDRQCLARIVRVFKFKGVTECN